MEQRGAARWPSHVEGRRGGFVQLGLVVFLDVRADQPVLRGEELIFDGEDGVVNKDVSDPLVQAEAILGAKLVQVLQGGDSKRLKSDLQKRNEV